MSKIEDVEKAASVSSTSPSHSSQDNVPFIPASLTVSNLQYEITIPKPLKEGEKKPAFKKLPSIQRALLTNVAAKAMPGRVLAIMGPSGSGNVQVTSTIDYRAQTNGF